jgi:hypothetical protein
LHGGHGLVRALVRDHLDDLSVAEGGDVGPEMRVVLAGPGRAHDHDHLVAGVDDVDELADASTTPRLPDERDDIVAVVAGAGEGRIAAVPLGSRNSRIASTSPRATAA